MGSLYRVPFFCADGLEEITGLLGKSGITVYAAHLQGERYYQETDYSGGSAFLSEKLKMKSEKLIVPVVGHGKGRYRFNI